MDFEMISNADFIEAIKTAPIAETWDWNYIDPFFVKAVSYREGMECFLTKLINLGKIIGFVNKNPDSPCWFVSSPTIFSYLEDCGVVYGGHPDNRQEYPSSANIEVFECHSYGFKLYRNSEVSKQVVVGCGNDVKFIINLTNFDF